MTSFFFNKSTPHGNGNTRAKTDSTPLMTQRPSNDPRIQYPSLVPLKRKPGHSANSTHSKTSPAPPYFPHGFRSIPRTVIDNPSLNSCPPITFSVNGSIGIRLINVLELGLTPHNCGLDFALQHAFPQNGLKQIYWTINVSVNAIPPFSLLVNISQWPGYTTSNDVHTLDIFKTQTNRPITREDLVVEITIQISKFMFMAQVSARK
jgi:hypothetical protein